MRSDTYGLKLFGDLDTPHVIDALTILAESGLHELVALYRMLLALESEEPDHSIVLDLSGYGAKVANLLKELNQIFVNRFLVYNFIFQYVVKDIEQERVILEKVRLLNENTLIDTVLIPLFQIMGYQNVKPVSYHGPGEEWDRYDYFIKKMNSVEEYIMRFR